MKTNWNLAFLLISGLLFVRHVSGQPVESGADSVAILQPKAEKNLFRFMENGAKEIQFNNKSPLLVQKQKNPGLSNAGNAVLTGLTGVGFNSVSGENWEMDGTIKCNDTLPDWRVRLFCEGYQTKERERVTNEDGSWSVHTEKNNVYNWYKNATGIIMEGKDTIGLFLIIMNPREDTLLKLWSPDIFLRKESPQNFKSKTKWLIVRLPPPSNDFATYGIFRGKSFILIKNGRDRKAWIVIDNVLSSSYHSDLNNPAAGKNNFLLSNLFINKIILAEDRRDLFRLAMMSQFINNSLSVH
jgi:hypothetical protein